MHNNIYINIHIYLSLCILYAAAIFFGLVEPAKFSPRNKNVEGGWYGYKDGNGDGMGQKVKLRTMNTPTKYFLMI